MRRMGAETYGHHDTPERVAGARGERTAAHTRARGARPGLGWLAAVVAAVMAAAMAGVPAAAQNVHDVPEATGAEKAQAAPEAGDAADEADASGKLEEIRREIDRSLERRRKLEGTIRSLGEETEALSRRLIATAAEIQSLEARITAGEDRLKKLAFEETTMRGELSGRREVLGNLLAGLQRLEKDPPPALAVNPDDALAAVRGAMLLGSVVPELRAQANALAQNLARLSDIRTAIAREHQELRINVESLGRAREEIAELLAQKRSLTKTVREELDRERERAEKLANEAATLSELVARLEERKRLEEEAAKAEAEAREKEEKRVAALGQAALAFSDARGRLYFPAQGVRISEFGDEDGTGGTSKGLSIATRNLAQVIAPSDGLVEYAGPFRGYGALLILNVGEGYHLLLAGMQEISAEVGQYVRAGEPVGQMGDQPARSVLGSDRSDGSSPILYIELRKDGDAIDPRPWWAGNDEKVRG